MASNTKGNTEDIKTKKLPKVIFTTLLIEKSPQALPLGAACIASAVKNHELTKDLCNVQLFPFNKEDKEFIKNSKTNENAAEYIANLLLEQNPVICGFSVFVWNRTILELVAKILKKHNIICIAGGPEVTAHPQVFTDFDYTISGAGERKVPQIIYKILSKSKADTALSTALEVVQNSQNFQTSQSLENLTSPYLDGTLNPADYEGALWELARGCPFKCSYCYESKGEQKVCTFPMERIKKELDLFAKLDVPQIFVLDPTYNANKQRALEILNLIAKKTPNTFYYFEARAEFIDKELAKAFTKIPCSLQIGLQSSNDEVLKLVHRPFNKKQFTKGINILNQTGITFGLDVIYGLPKESINGFKESINFAISLYPNNLELFCLSVLPGTDLYDRATELGLKFQTNPPYNIIETSHFSKADVQKASKIANSCNIFYNQGRAVPWFNTICQSLKIKPSQFFNLFSEYLDQQNIVINCQNTNHKEIETLQKKFVTKLFTEKNLKKQLVVALDLISLHGAISRKEYTGISEKVKLMYPVEYLMSEYAFDLDFFAKNVIIKERFFKT